MSDKQALKQSLTMRFGELAFRIPTSNATLKQMAGRGSCRQFTEEPVDNNLIQMLCAVALASPTKSDLQQRDIVIIADKNIRHSIDCLLGEDSWTNTAPALLVFCANNRRQRQLSEWRNKSFPNDHLDTFFNASVDAGIALASFVNAAESAGLGCCPISQIRNHCEAISTLLHLPQHVFPMAGLALGWPVQAPTVSMRLPLSVTVHKDLFSENNLKANVEHYDQHRASQQPYKQQRNASTFGKAKAYSWSEDKARQYTEIQRADFGAFVRAKGFSLE